jgi:predicted nucleic acid-binding Zn ribbon protein
MAVKESPKTVKEIRWQPHMHCPICGNAMTLSKEYCSENCESMLVKYKEKQKKRNRRLYTILLPIIFIVVILILLQPGLIP